MNITMIAEKLNLKKKDLCVYGENKAKIISEIPVKKEGHLILVTSVNPTPYGEGKTTISIGLNDILNHYGYQAIASLREPSLGPVFGKKGGATGGGKASLIPEEDINIHFTGDFHAITSANNLLCAAIDNHIYQGNELDIDENKIYVHRCLDMNDRALREITLSNGRKEKFDITTASEVMAIFCLSKNMEDLKNRLGHILIAKTKQNKKIYAKDLKVEGAMTRLLKEAFYPNLVQTKEHYPVLVHGGPFANIAHGCSSIRSTKLALSLADYVITESGFGSDMGGIKFFDIKCRMNDLKPSLTIINTTIRSLKYHGKNLQDGICNLQYHIDHMRKFQNNVCVILNEFEDDVEEDKSFVKRFCEDQDIPFFSLDSYLYGSENKQTIADGITRLCKKSEVMYPYDLKDCLEEKIQKLCQQHLNTKNIVYNEISKQKLKQIHEDYPICISKTPYSITDDPKKLGYPKDEVLHVTDIKVQNGAKMIIVYMGNVITMPGLPKEPNYEKFNEC